MWVRDRTGEDQWEREMGGLSLVVMVDECSGVVSC